MDYNKFVRDILDEMPEAKKEQLHDALCRNNRLTSFYGLTRCKFSVYKEGWYVQFEGTRSSFTVWANDNDGEFTYTRKPNEKKLHKIYAKDLMFDEWEFSNY